MSEMQFGWVIQPVPRSEEGRATLIEDNRAFLRALRGTFASAWVEDHFMWNERDTLECWTTLAFLAAEFPEFVWGPLVLGQVYRNPALVAKMAATLHLLTRGRFLLGIGAGWKEDEHRAYGWEFPSVRERVEQLDEAAQIIRMMWRDTRAYFAGKHYHIAGAYCEPRPNPPPPLMIGGDGEKLTLRVVARHADWWNAAFLPADEYARKLAALEKHCAAEKRDPAAIKKTHFAFISLSENPDRLIHRDDLYVTAGSPDAVTRELEQFRALGVEHVMIRFLDFPQTEGLELFLRQILPRLK